MSDQGPKGEKRPKSQSYGFEANLRGKLSKGFASKKGPPKPEEVVPAAPDTVQHGDVVGEAPVEEISTKQPEQPEFIDVMDIDDVDQHQSSRRSWRDLIFRVADAELKMGVDINEDPDDYEGESADEAGYHYWTAVPIKQNMAVINLHNNDPRWLKDNHVLPDGIRSPEGYLWGRKPTEMFWFEIHPDYKKLGTMSQQYALDNKVVKVYQVDEAGKAGLEPSLIGTCDDPYFLKLCCGEPTPIRELVYNTHPLMPELRGPEILDAYIPPSDLPPWLYVYDQDDLTLPCYATPERDKIDWLAPNHPLLPIPAGVKPLKYRLVDPTGRSLIDDDSPFDPEANHATLILSKRRVISSGYWTHVYEGQISLQDPKYPSRLRVVAKVNKSARTLEYLEREATMYNLFPDTFTREYSGVQLVEPSHFARPLTRVVPAFYGYYKYIPEENVAGPQDTMNSQIPEQSNNQESLKDDIVIDRNPEDTRSAILLTEYCGSPVRYAEELTQYQKLEIVSLLDRFHKAGFIYGQYPDENHSLFRVLRQPGPRERLEPLGRTPRWARTPDRPSFRLVGLSEVKWFGLRSEKEKIEKRLKHFMSFDAYLRRERQALGKYLSMRLF